MVKELIRKWIFLLITMMTLSSHEAYSGVIIFTRDLETYHERIKQDIFRRISCPFPDLEEAKKQYPSLTFEFVPPTTLQILTEDMMKRKDLKLSYTQWWGGVHPINVENHIAMLFISRFHYGRFFTINEQLQKLGNTGRELIERARALVVGRKTMGGLLLTPELYDRIIEKETEAFSKRLTLLWNVAYDSKGAPFHEKGGIMGKFFSKGENGQDSDLSYSVRPLDGLSYCNYSGEGFDLRNPFKNGCLLSHLRHYETYGKGESPLIQGSLYCLTIPHEELEGLPTYFYDARALNFFHMGVESYGECARHHIFFKAKKGENLSIYNWGKVTPEEPEIPESREARRDLIKNWYKWMAFYLDVIYEDGQVLQTSKERAPHKFYQRFYHKHLDAVLEQRFK